MGTHHTKDRLKIDGRKHPVENIVFNAELSVLKGGGAPMHHESVRAQLIDRSIDRSINLSVSQSAK